MNISSSLIILLGSAVSIAFIHTIIGPDHYLPFIVISRARQWSLKKTILLTVVCGLGHVFSSILLGILGISIGAALSRLEWFESIRGQIAAWGLIAFGLLYSIIALRQVFKRKPHEHPHTHENGTVHTHSHTHHLGHSHIHGDNRKLTPWILFIIFIFGPCEPLIPLLIYPAAEENMTGVILVALLFSFVTVATMVTTVSLFYLGFKQIKIRFLEKYGNVLAGATIALSGLAVQFLGL